MPDTPTYVTSVNGSSGSFQGYLDNVLVLDGDDIHIYGGTGTTIAGGIRSVCFNVRPLLMTQIGAVTEDEYVMCVQSGIPYQPAN